MKRFIFVSFVAMSVLCAGCSGGAGGLRTTVPSAATPTATHARTNVDWPVWGFDPARSGFNSAERRLTVANVHRLRVRWQISFNDGSFADAAPILIARVLIGGSYRPMLFETTKNGVTFGIEAASGHVVWKFATSGGRTTISAPAADQSDKAIYAPGIDGKVHKLDASNGQETSAPGLPAVISLMPSTELDESPLNVANGYLYATAAGDSSDLPPYDGHIVALKLSTGEKTIFNSLCSEKRDLIGPHGCSYQRSGIWSRGGVVVDPDPSMNGQIYAATGNGDFDANRGGHNYGDSVLALTPSLSNLLGSYTPTDYHQLQESDHDLGSASPALVPDQPTSRTPWMLVQGGKDAVLKLIDRAPLPGVGHELQLMSLPRMMYSTPAVWTDPSNQTWIFVGLQDRIHAYRLETNKLGVSRLAMKWSQQPGTSPRGTSPVVANGIVFVAFDGELLAYNALTGTKLWSSAMRSAGKTIGPVHFESPIVVNGSVYCSDENGNLTAYALP
jgi:outer membrane protein assembly factor BamB